MRSKSFQSIREIRPSEPRQIGEILPDVLRRYGITVATPANPNVLETRVDRVDAVLGENEGASSRHALTECHV